MLVLRVQINDELPVTAGAEDLGVLNAIVTAGGRLGTDGRHGRPDKPNIHLTLGGLTARATDMPDEHLRWLSLRNLSVGDRVIIQVLEADSADPIESGHDAEKRAHDEREYFEHCKKTYFGLRNKYESAG